MPEPELQTDHYEVLGIAPDASPDEVKRAYKKRAFDFHPDRRPGTTAEVVLRRLHEAYAVLRDPAKREHYDWLLSQRVARPSTPAPSSQARSSQGPSSQGPSSQAPAPRARARDDARAKRGASPPDDERPRDDDERWRREGRVRYAHSRQTAAVVKKVGSDHVEDNAPTMRDIERAYDDERRLGKPRSRASWVLLTLLLLAAAVAAYALVP